jgi:hypothetical protein
MAARQSAANGRYKGNPRPTLKKNEGGAPANPRAEGFLTARTPFEMACCYFYVSCLWGLEQRTYN